MSDYMKSRANHPSARFHLARWEAELREQIMDDEAIALTRGMPLPAQPWADTIVMGVGWAAITAAIAVSYWYGGAA